MTLNELRYMVALSKTGHFGRAAEQCHVSQPTLSVAIKKLEDELGVILFERSRTRVWPTPIGQRIINRAVCALDETAAISDIAQQAKEPCSEPLKLGAIYTIGPYLFPHLVPQLKQRMPELQLYIEENFTAVLRQKLRSGELDAIIISLPFSEPDVATQELYDEPLVAVLPIHHPLAGAANISPAQLQQENLLLMAAGHCFRDQVSELIPQVTSTTVGSSLETLKYMVASGLGVTILPWSASNSGNASGLQSLPLQAPSASRSVALAWRLSFPRHQLIETLNLAIRACQVQAP
jgi:LysR family hydrogen peroxide-inducible transcriptional activator